MCGISCASTLMRSAATVGSDGGQGKSRGLRVALVQLPFRIPIPMRHARTFRWLPATSRRFAAAHPEGCP